MKITLTSRIAITGAPEPLARKICDTLTIENPRWIDNHWLSRWNGETDYWLTFYENHPGGLSIPRGAMGLILFFCKEMGKVYDYCDVHVGVLAASARARQQVCRGVGISNNNNITNG